MEIEATTALQAWKKSLDTIVQKGRAGLDSDERPYREIIGLNVKIVNTQEIAEPIKILSSTGKWMYPSLEDIERSMLSKHKIPGYYYNYGNRMFANCNQIDSYIIPLLQKEKASRRGTIIFYDPQTDSSLHRKEIPSIVMVNCNIINNSIHITAVIRSNDFFFGWPANIYQIAALQKHIAKKLNCEQGPITTYSISAHVFEDNLEHIHRIAKL